MATATTIRLSLLCGAACLLTAVAAAAPPYPPAMRGGQITDYHGVQIADPYRWMEDLDSPQTRAWVQAEAKLTEDYLAAIPDRGNIARQLRSIWNYERWTAPEHHGKYWFYTHNDGLQNQSVVYVTANPQVPRAAGQARLLLDPNLLSKDGTVSLREMSESDDGHYLAYALSDAGSDWQVWHLRDVDTGKDLPDELRWSKFGGGSWRKDGSGFYYTAYDPPQDGAGLKAASQFEKLYFHKLGDAQSADTLVYTRSDGPDWYVGGQVTDDGRYLVVQANHGTDVQNTLLVQDLAAPGAAGVPPVIPVIPEPTANYDVIGNIGGTLFVRTDDSAPRYRIVAIDLANPAPDSWRTVVPEGAATLDAATLVGGQLIVQYMEDARSTVQRFAPDGKPLGAVAMPGLGTAAGFDGRSADTLTFYTYSSYTTPPSVYSLDLTSGKTAVWRTPQLAGYSAAEFETTQVFYSSRDGTRVPMFVTARKGVAHDGTNPTILYGYGGFNIASRPAFAPAIAGWVQMGGVYAVANLRGGGEYGRAWHEGGMKTNKQNVFDDFIAAAETLEAQKWTSARRLAIVGRSNGGLLVGAVEEQRPDLFAAAVPFVGVMDMLRFRDFTVGKGWESDYGSVDNPDEFKALLAYSPLHNVRSGVNYPATLILTGDHDDRVFPAHSFKFAAAMQNADPNGRPILIRIDTRAGHGQGKPTAKQIEEFADAYAFIRQAFAQAQKPLPPKT
jgi:prolyl oligopeptidase